MPWGCSPSPEFAKLGDPKGLQANLSNPLGAKLDFGWRVVVPPPWRWWGSDHSNNTPFSNSG